MLLSCPLLNNLAISQNGNTVTQAKRFIKIMRDANDGLLDFLLDAAEGTDCMSMRISGYQVPENASSISSDRRIVVSARVQARTCCWTSSGKLVRVVLLKAFEADPFNPTARLCFRLIPVKIPWISKPVDECCQ